MTNNSLFGQVKCLSTSRRIGIILLGFVLFALLFFLEYTYSNKHGDLVGSIIYALPFPCGLTASLLSLTSSNNEMPQLRAPWHKRQHILIGLMLLFVSIIYLVQLVNSLLNNNLPDALGLPIEGVGFLLILFIFLRFVVVRRSGTSAK